MDEMLFQALREDIAGLKLDVVKVLDRHESDIEQLKNSQRDWAGRIAGASFILVLLIEIGVQIVAGAFR